MLETKKDIIKEKISGNLNANDNLNNIFRASYPECIIL